MNILITNIWLVNPGGTEVYVRDLAIALHRRGMYVEVYSPQLGGVADEIKNEGIHIVDSTDDLVATPDIIHGHHFTPTMDVIVKFPGTPVVYFLHDRTHPVDTPPRHSSIIQYVAVDYNCLDRLVIDGGIEEKNTKVLYNWVDTSRFKTRQNFSDRPKRALVFSNYATHENYFKVIEDACNKIGLELDGIGLGFRNSIQKPENVLGNYDIIFAKAKAAMEALSTGAGVIVCDSRGLGEMVTTKNYSHFRNYNFGMKTLTRSIEPDLIIKEIEKYNVEENKKVMQAIRKDADFILYVDEIVKLYHLAIKNFFQEKSIIVYHEKTIHDYLLIKKNLFIEQRTNENRIAVEKNNIIIAHKENEIRDLTKSIEAKDSVIANLTNTLNGKQKALEDNSRLINPDYPMRAAVKNLLKQLYRKIVKR
jgi:glycosyltransferase involved in cell wall biosynthesis